MLGSGEVPQEERSAIEEKVSAREIIGHERMTVTCEHILQAFPPAPPWRDPLPGTRPEILGIERDFRGKSWPEIPAQLCNLHHDAYNVLDPEPLAYLLPAFLCAAVTDSKGTAAEFLVYFA